MIRSVTRSTLPAFTALTVSGFSAKIVGSTPLSNFDGTACADHDQGTIASVRQVLRGPMHHFRIQREFGGSLDVSVGRQASRAATTTRWSSRPIGSAISEK